MSSAHTAPAVWFPTIRACTGTDMFTQRLCDGLNARGIRAQIAWLPLRAEYAPWSVTLPEPPGWANVVHVNSWLHPRFLPRELPVVATIHHSIHHPDSLAWKGRLRAAYHKHWIAPIERRVLRQAHHRTAVSSFAARATRETLLDVSMQVVYNGVDTDKFKPGDRHQKPGTPFRLLYVGSWMNRKGVDLLAPIMRELGDRFELRFTGGRSENNRIDVPRNMRDIGRLQDELAVADAMRDADAFLFPSRSEGFGLVVAEAMACGLPVVATDIPVLSEIIDHGRTGMLCPVNDWKEFAAAVRDIASNANRYEGMSSEARSRVVARFSNSSMIQSYLDVYGKLLA